MLFALFLLDHDGTDELRELHHATHRAHGAQLLDRIAFAGPLVDDDGVRAIGSLIVADFDSRAAVVAWLEGDAYYTAGIYSECAIHAFKNLHPQKTGFPPPKG